MVGKFGFIDTLGARFRGTTGTSEQLSLSSSFKTQSRMSSVRIGSSSSFSENLTAVFDAGILT